MEVDGKQPEKTTKLEKENSVTNEKLPSDMFEQSEDQQINTDKTNILDESKIQELENTLYELNNKYLRVLAEYENFRKRSDKEKQEIIKFSNESLLTDIIPVMDSFDKAILEFDKQKELQNDLQEQKYKEATLLLRNQLTQTLEKRGLKKIISLNQKFDPTIHQAIQKLTKEDIETETVVEEYMCGYELNGRLIRPAMVLVAVPK